MSHYATLHAPLTDNEDEDCPPELTTLTTHETERSKWSHIDDLDDFFTRVYHYHQSHGMPSLVLTELLNLFQIVFLASFSVYTSACVDYATLFRDQRVVAAAGDDPADVNATVVKKKLLSDVLVPLGVCLSTRVSSTLWLVMAVVMTFWTFRLVKAVYNIARYAEISSFYSSALNIKTNGELTNVTWHEVQERLLLVQRKYHLCIHKSELTELDIYNRILRFRNYEVAMVNQGLLPPKIDGLPVLGQL